MDTNVSTRHLFLQGKAMLVQALSAEGANPQDAESAVNAALLRYLQSGIEKNFQTTEQAYAWLRETARGFVDNGRMNIPVRSSLESLTDEELLDLCSKAKEQAERHASFDLLVRRYGPQLRGYLRRYLGRHDLADDAMQEALLKIFQRAGQFDATRKASSWIYTIATHTAIDFLRREHRRHMLSLDQERNGNAAHDEVGAALAKLACADSADPQSGLLDREKEELLQEAVDRLPQDLRSVIVMNTYEHAKYERIAEAHGIPIGTVKSRIHSARLRLRQMLTETGGYFAEASPA